MCQWVTFWCPLNTGSLSLLNKVGKADMVNIWTQKLFWSQSYVFLDCIFCSAKKLDFQHLFDHQMLLTVIKGFGYPKNCWTPQKMNCQFSFFNTKVFFRIVSYGNRPKQAIIFPNNTFKIITFFVFPYADYCKITLLIYQNSNPPVPMTSQLPSIPCSSRPVSHSFVPQCSVADI